MKKLQAKKFLTLLLSACIDKYVREHYNEYSFRAEYSQMRTTLKECIFIMRKTLQNGLRTQCTVII